MTIDQIINWMMGLNILVLSVTGFFLVIGFLFLVTAIYSLIYDKAFRRKYLLKLSTIFLMLLGFIIGSTLPLNKAGSLNSIALISLKPFNNFTVFIYNLRFDRTVLLPCNFLTTLLSINKFHILFHLSVVIPLLPKAIIFTSTVINSQLFFAHLDTTAAITLPHGHLQKSFPSFCCHFRTKKFPSHFFSHSCMSLRT